jgi:hypothetical protein
VLRSSASPPAASAARAGGRVVEPHPQAVAAGRQTVPAGEGPLVEDALLIALVEIVVILALVVIGGNITNAFYSIAASIGS